MNHNPDTNLKQKLGLVMVISITLLLICLGVVHIRNSGIPVPIPIIVLMFALSFITGTVFLEHRGGVFPWILLGGGVIATISTIIFTCVFSGIVFTVTGKILAIPWGVLVYSLSTCMILSVIALNILPYLPGWISQLSNKIESMDIVKSDCEADYFFDDNKQPDPDEDMWPDPDTGPPEDCRV